MQHSRNSVLARTAFWVSLTALVFAISAQAQVTQDFHRTVPLSSNGRVSLENINGNVTVTGWERNEVQVDAVKKARDQQKLDEARIEVDASSDSVQIKTKYPEGRNNNNPATVTYELHVPRMARLDHINLVNGSLEVSQVNGDIDANLVNGKTDLHDLSGRLNISAVNGTITANFRTLDNVKEIHLKSVNGAINLGLPASPNAEVSASTVNGGITTDFPLQVKGKFMGHHLDGTLGSGGTHIELNNVNGSIRLGPGLGNL
ncbi:MAG TPA: DUF4097 family beta strand repeat-containing protein [Terriglobales bacterium]